MLNIFKKQTASLGQIGEKAAAIYLKKIGYELLCSNFTNTSGRRLGEIDLIAKDGNEIVFVEVKTRKKSLNGNLVIPEENITYQKLYKLRKIANFYIKQNNFWACPYRFDALSLIYDENTKTFKIKHIKSIFL